MGSMSRFDTASSEAIGERRSLGSSESSDLAQDRRGAFIDNIRYRWESKKDFVMSTMTCIFSVDVFDVFIQSNMAEAGVYHYAVTFAFIGFPIYYMQLLLGQYTQLGIISLKYLNPLSHGVALTFIMTTFLWTVMQSILLDDAIVLFITSMQSQLQWLICPYEVIVPCYNTTQNCTNLVCDNGEKVFLPAAIFYNHHFRNNPVTDAAKMKLEMPEFQKISIHGICWFFTCTILISTINHYMKAIRILRYTTLGLIFFLMIVPILSDLGVSLADLFSIRTGTFTSSKPWLLAIAMTVQLLALGRSFHVVHGSYFKPNESCCQYALMVVLLYYALIVMCCLFTTAAINNVAQYANIDKDHLNLFFLHGRQTLFVVIPQSFVSIAVPQLWSCIYFAILILVAISQQLSHLTFVQMSLSDIYPALLRYKKYSVIIFSIFSGIISCLLLDPESYSIYIAIATKLPQDAAFVNVILMSCVICWIYGVQRFSDDIHFITGQPPSKIYRICWYIIPAIVTYAYVRLQVNFYNTSHYKTKILQISLFLVYISPVPIVAIIEMFKFIKARNLVGLLQPDERFGSPDPNERELRRMFNPRAETKSRRRMQVCKHRCLLGSKPLTTIAETEIENLRDENYDNTNLLYEELD